MKKLISIILGLSLVLSMSVTGVYADYQKNVTHIFELQDFEEDVSKLQVIDSTLYSVSQSATSDATRGKYAEANFKGNSWQGISTLGFSDKVKKAGDFVTIEFDFRIPSTVGDVAQLATGNLDFYLGDLKTSGASRYSFLRVQLAKMNFVAGGYSSGYFGSNQITTDVWYHVTADIAPHLGKQRVLVDSDQKRIVSLYSSATTLYNYLGANSERFAVAFGGATETTPASIHLDNIEVYRHSDVSGFGAGESFLNEEMNYAETTGTNTWGVWAPDSNMFVFVVADGSETRNASCISEDGDSNKFLRMDSGDKPVRTYFRRSISRTNVLDFENIALAKNATKTADAILYQTKIRFDDVTKANTTTLTTVPYLADGSAKADERYVFSINPKEGVAKIGLNDNAKTYNGLRILSKKWYTLNLFHNVDTGYLRAEIISDSGEKQIFEGCETDETVNYGNIASIGFNNTSEEHTVVDYDAVRVFAATCSDAKTFYTLSDFSADKADGAVTATINVASDMTNVVSASAKVIIASYNGNKLQKLTVSNVVPTTGTQTFTLDGVADGDEVKVMLWDAAVNTLKPLSAPIIK